MPYTRGREVSREAENILREARALAAQGAREIWLLGQNVNSYRAGEWGFCELLDAVSQVSGVLRVRFTSPYPNDWNNALSDLMAARKTICNQLHLPFQSGSDRILGLMRRQHTIEEYLAKIRYMRAINPGLELSTDLIVGFPTESDADFERTLEVLREVRYSLVFPFKYSPRPKTKASEMPDDVPLEVKDERLKRVIELQQQIDGENTARYLGSEQEILIDSASTKERGTMIGRTDGFYSVAVHEPSLEIGDLVPVRITEASGHWLRGEVLGAAPAAI